MVQRFTSFFSPTLRINIFLIFQKTTHEKTFLPAGRVVITFQ
jgi:hypothetical protein